MAENTPKQAHGKQSSIRQDDGASMFGRVQINGTTYFEVATIKKITGGGRDVLLGDIRMSKPAAELLAQMLLRAVKEG